MKIQVSLKMTLILLALLSSLSLIASGFSKESASDLLNKGDSAYKLRKDLTQAEEAFSNYQEALKQEGDSVKALWRASMACHYLGMKSQDEDKKKTLFVRGIEYGEKSLSFDSQCAPCHFWTGINKALYGESVGVLKMLSSLSKIEEHLKKTVEIDPSYAEAGAWRVLGIINQKVPSIFGGSRTEAIKDFRNAINTVPREPMNYLFLARLLMEERETKEEALKVTRLAIRQPVPTHEYVESLEARKEVEELNQELESQTKLQP